MSETERPWRCKVIVLRRAGALIRFGIDEGTGIAAFPWAPFPDLMAIDRDLGAWASGTLGLDAVRIHERFVERPDPNGTIYYLIEAGEAVMDANAPLLWLDAGQALRRLGTLDRAALARAIRFLSAIA